MTSIQADQDKASAGLTLNLSSNNPFRNRATSPSQSLSSPFDDPPSRSLSRNPFLDPSISTKASLPNIKTTSENMNKDRPDKDSPTVEDFFSSLKLDETKPAASKPSKPDAARAPPPNRGPPPRAPLGRENSRSGRGPPPPGHRPAQSQEDAMRRKAKVEGPAANTRSPSRRLAPDRRPRRNSESSAVDLTEEEKERKRRREREARERRREPRDKKPTASRKLDLIDQLDATSIYGTGLFHHDGPYDALNKARNKKGNVRAPMEAFPEGSLNNVLGGSGPLNKRPDHAALMGLNDEAFEEWSTGAKEQLEPIKLAPGAVFDPTSRGDIVYGDESAGLGASTFLEGTPAPRREIQKREEEMAAAATADGGLQRKKSLAQRIRNINRGPRDYSTGRMTNPDGAYGSRPSPAGYPAANSSGEANPFFAEYDRTRPGGEEISVRRKDSYGDAMSPTSPRNGSGALERRATTDATASMATASADASKPTGIIGRMKSLKGGRRRPAPPPGTGQGGPQVSGTAV